MSFRFSWFCELLEDFDQGKCRQRTAHARLAIPSHRIVNDWYNKYNDRINRNEASALALLSALFPERRPDRTYNLREKRLTQIFGRALGLGRNRLRLLCSWQDRDGPDFPTCVEIVMTEAEIDPPRPQDEVTVEELDIALTQIAANTIASAAALKTKANDKTPFTILAPIIRRLKGSEAKWLVRMMFKSYKPIEIPEHTALHGFHFLLPKLLHVQDSLQAAIGILNSPELDKLPRHVSKDFENALVPIMFKAITPQVGVMIRRQAFDKARSIKHCLQLAGSRTISVERKYDGEYCQIHIDKLRGPNCIQIFSKSGRDSTQDRIALYHAIISGLRLSDAACKIKSRAILEGELLVYSKATKQILPFHHIRKHVHHGGRCVGTESDSPKRVGDDLMVVFFDLLMLNDKILMRESHSVRRAYLKGIVTPIEGVSQVVERVIIDFHTSEASAILRNAFGTAIRKRWEGFMLKGVEDPYFSWKKSTRGIKLKKDYISGLGDTADLCIVGGRRDARKEADLDLKKLSWTYFYIGCLLNKEGVRRFEEKPIFRIIDRIGPGSLSKEDILNINVEGRFIEHDFVLTSKFMDIHHPRKDFPEPSHIFKDPIVVELMGAGYERPQTVNFYVLRFPRRLGSNIKFHHRNSIKGTLSFERLQAMAHNTLQGNEETASEEDIQWIQRLLAADPGSKYIMHKSQSQSPSKTPPSVTTLTLTPVTVRLASTQPSSFLVRTDLEEVSPNNYQSGQRTSAPQSPERWSNPTTSPITSPTMRAESMVNKRNSNAISGDLVCSFRSKKRKVGLEATVDTEHFEQRALSDITNTAPGQGASDLMTTTASQRILVESIGLDYGLQANLLPTSVVLTSMSLEEHNNCVAEATAPNELRSKAQQRAPIQSDSAVKCQPFEVDEIGGLCYGNFQLPQPRGNGGTLKSLVYVPPSVARHHPSFTTHAQGFEQEFSSSPKLFLSKILDQQFGESSTTATEFFVLVDSAKPEEAVTILQRLCQVASVLKRERLRGSPVSQSWAIDFPVFDFRVLQIPLATFKVGQGARRLCLDGGESYFCGTLQLRNAPNTDGVDSDQIGLIARMEWGGQLRGAPPANVC